MKFDNHIIKKLITLKMCLDWRVNLRE